MNIGNTEIWEMNDHFPAQNEAFKLDLKRCIGKYTLETLGRKHTCAVKKKWKRRHMKENVNI